jgi:hemoglobin
VPKLPIVASPAPRERDAPSADPSAAPAPPDVRDEDIHGILVRFYAAVAEDPLLAPYFADLDMAAHMPRIADFWSTLLFHSGRYSGNAFRPHLAMPGLTAAHFDRWLATLERTVDAAHAGPVAENMKSLGHRIAFSMQLRLGITPTADRADQP